VSITLNQAKTLKRSLTIAVRNAANATLRPLINALIARIIGFVLHYVGVLTVPLRTMFHPIAFVIINKRLLEYVPDSTVETGEITLTCRQPKSKNSS
jgi:hypothetical protein